MAWAFDTLGYSKRRREAGVPVPQAEAHAEATREFVMTELVTKQDLQAAIETQTLRLTVRLGGIVAAGVAVAIGILGYCSVSTDRALDPRGTPITGISLGSGG